MLLGRRQICDSGESAGPSRRPVPDFRFRNRLRPVSGNDRVRSPACAVLIVMEAGVPRGHHPEG